MLCDAVRINVLFGYYRQWEQKGRDQHGPESSDPGTWIAQKILVVRKDRRLDTGRTEQKKRKNLFFEKELLLLHTIYSSIKIRKYSGINLTTKKVKNLDAENCKGKVKEDINKWKIYYPWVIRFSIKMSVLTQIDL